MDERRLVPRLSMQIPLVLTFPESGQQFDGRTRDISAGGVFFYAAAPVVERQTIDILMTFSSDMTPSPITVSCNAMVLRVERESVPENTGIAITIQGFNFVHSEREDRREFRFGPHEL